MPDIFDTIAAVNALLPSGTAVRVGAEHYSEHVAGTNRVLWVPQQDAFQAPPNRGHSPRRAIRTCVAKWSVLCFGRGDDKVDPFASLRAAIALRDSLIAALHAVAQGQHSILGGGFEGQDGSAILQAGRLYVLQVGFNTAVLERARLTTATIEYARATVDTAGNELEVAVGAPLPQEPTP